MESPLVYIPEFCFLLGIPKRTVYNKISTKDPSIPRPRYVGKHPVWLRAEVMAHIENLPTEPPSMKKRKVAK